MSVVFSPSGIEIVVDKDEGTLHATTVYSIPTVQLLIAGAVLFLIIFYAFRGRRPANDI